MPADCRNTHRTIRLAGLGAAALVFVAGQLVPGTASASWDSQKSDCLKVIEAPEKSEEKRLMVCADLFGAEARLQNLSGTEKSAIEKGLRYLYDNGSDLGARIARDALARLDVKLPIRDKKGDGEARPGGGEPASRTRYDPPEAKVADAKAADKLADDAIKLLKKKKYKDGAGILEKALAKDPRSEKVLYNLACAEANLPGKAPSCFTRLQNLADLGTDTSNDKLVKARADADFDAVREEPDFKRITGYLRIQIVNTLGEPGDTGVENLQKAIEKLGNRKPDKKDDDAKPQEAPSLQFKPHAKPHVLYLAELTGDPQARLDPMQGDGKYDVVIRWGSKIDAQGKAINVGPDTADEAMAKARQKQNKVLAQPESAINKVNKVVDTPGRVISEAGHMKDRVVNTVDKAKGAVDKVKDLEKVPDKIKDVGKIKGL